MPPSAERAIVHGVPPSAVWPEGDDRNIPDRDRERPANCAIGNGFHLSSIMVVFILMLQGAEGLDHLLLPGLGKVIRTPGSRPTLRPCGGPMSKSGTDSSRNT